MECVECAKPILEKPGFSETMWKGSGKKGQNSGWRTYKGSVIPATMPQPGVQTEPENRSGSYQRKEKLQSISIWIS